MRVRTARTHTPLFVACVLVLLLVASGAAFGQWTSIGPDGGDARSLSFDPQNPDHILLGTSSGDLFASQDAGNSWSRVAHLGTADDLVLDHIIFSPQNQAIYLAAWSIDNNSRGDLFRSRDGGRTWQVMNGLHNKSIRSFVISPSDPRIMIAGTLDGVWRSNDAGDTWNRISPEGHAEIHNIESLAIDPRNPEIIYAGTWHLPWKTEDGGRSWHSMKDGIVDDSDVFSIIIDHSDPSTVYLSACSGIYKSTDAGVSFHKVQGIPFSARRTRMLHQDPKEAGVVYAGTTEGLWRTNDGAATWKRVTGPNVIVNDISVDPRDNSRVLLATDRSGVLLSTNASVTWAAANRGFVHRQVTALVQDPRDPNTLYAGVVNDKEYGGVFVTHDDGAHWAQRNSGLGTKDVFTMRAAANGDILAGTNNGVYKLVRNGAEWRPINDVVNETRVPVKHTVRLKSGKSKTVETSRVEVKRGRIEGRVNDLQVDGKHWYAATSQGVFVSDNDGRTWRGGPVLGNSNFVALNAPVGQPAMLLPQNDSGSRSRMLVAATINRLMISNDDGATWTQADLALAAIHSVTVMSDSSVWVAALEGAFRSADGGAHWEHVLNGLPQHNIVAVSADVDGRHMLATTGANVLYESTDAGATWRSRDAGWTIRSVMLGNGRIVGATAFDGIVTQPSRSAEIRTASGSGNE